MRKAESSNFSFLANHDPLLHEIGASAEAVFHEDSNAALVKLRQLAEHLARNAAAQLGLPSDRDSKFFDVIASLRSRLDIDDKVIRLLHHLRQTGNEAVHEYKHDHTEAAKALRSARELCIWYFRTFGRPEPSFRPGPFIQPRNWKQEEQQQREEIARLQSELETGRKNSEHQDALLHSLRGEEARLRAIVEEREMDAAAAFDLADEQSKKLATLRAEYEEHLSGLGPLQMGSATFMASISQRSRYASELVQADWAPEIKLRDAFEDYQLTANQEDIVLELETFLSAPDEHVFILSGHAGTGKTFITKGLSDFLAATGRSCVITAPTGKAARVITQKSGRLASTIHSKIYSMNDIKEYKVEEVDGSETFKLYADLEVNTDADNTVYIVDEASMVSDVYSEGEFFRFGSGRLLSDLMKYVNLDHNDHTKKVIFIGDTAQLPPVGMSSSPALDQKHLSKTFNINATRWGELSQVVRQSAESGILSIAHTLRDSLSKRSFNKLSLGAVTPDVHVCQSADELVAGYLSASGNKVDDVAMIIASSNAEVATFNAHVRRHLFPGHESVTPGDKLVVVMNCRVGNTPLNNGDLVYVVGVGQAPEIKSVMLKIKNTSTGRVDETEVTLQFKDVQIAFRTPNGEVVREHVKIVESLLYSAQPNLSSDETKALYIDFKRRNPHLPRSGPVLKDALLSDPYFRALRVKFGYALTCHKAQGSEWAEVFVECNAYMGPRTEEYFRWLYTAITRSSSRLHLLNPPDLKPWDRPRSIRAPAPNVPRVPNAAGVPRPTPDEPAEDTSLRPSESTPETPPQCAPDETGTSNVGRRTGDPVLDGIYEAVSARVSGVPGAKIDSVNHHSWQEAYFITDGTSFTRINIAYNAKGVVGSIMPVPRDEFGTEIAARLADIQGLRFVNHIPTGAGETKFAREVFNDFLPVFSERAALNGLRIVSATEEQWNLRVILGNSTATGELAIYCNGEGRISTYSWIGRPPHRSLQESLDATMANL